MDWGPGTPAFTAFGDLRDAVVGFAQRARAESAGPAPAINPALVGEQIIHLSHSIDILRRELAVLAGAFSASGEWEAQGSGSDTDWLRHQARLSYGDASALLVVGEHLSELPQSSVAVDAGEVGFGHVVCMARNAAFVARRGTGIFSEAPLLERAGQESVSRFRHTCLNMRHVEDPDGVVADEASAVEMRDISFCPQEGGITFINLRLDTPTAVMIQSDTCRRATRLGPDDTRSRSRREADAMIERLLGDGGPAVEVTVSCTAETLLGLPGAPAADLDYIEPISGEMLRRLSCDATFTKILLDDRLVPVSAAHSRRVPTRKERQAMNLQQKHCRGRGCQRPAGRCSPHHVVWYCRSRRTQISEMVLLCPHHHWMVHEGGWNVALKDDGEVMFIPPFARGPSRSEAL